jgi:hypothetical protein
MGVALSITAFPVLARILAELKLLTTDLGRMAMPAAAVNDVTAWILLALAIAMSCTGSPFVSVYVLLCGVGFVGAATFLVRPVLLYMARRSPEGGAREGVVRVRDAGRGPRGGVHHRRGRHPRRVRRVRDRCAGAQGGRVCQRADGEGGGRGVVAVPAALLRVQRAQDRRRHHLGVPVVGAPGAGHHDGVRGDVGIDHRLLLGSTVALLPINRRLDHL